MSEKFISVLLEHKFASIVNENVTRLVCRYRSEMNMVSLCMFFSKYCRPLVFVHRALYYIVCESEELYYFVVHIMTKKEATKGRKVATEMVRTQ